LGCMRGCIRGSPVLESAMPSDTKQATSTTATTCGGDEGTGGRARRSSTIASSKATQALIQQAAVGSTDRDATGLRRSGRKKTPAIVVNVGRAPKRPTSSSARPMPTKAPRRSSKRRCRTSFQSGLERHPHQVCTRSYGGFTTNDDGGRRSVTCFVEPGFKMIGPTSLSWLRPRRTKSVWEQIVLNAEMSRQRSEGDQMRAVCNQEQQTTLVIEPKTNAKSTVESKSVANPKNVNVTELATSHDSEEIAESCVGLPAWIPPSTTHASFVLANPFNFPIKSNPLGPFAETLKALAAGPFPPTSARMMNNIGISQLQASMPLAMPVVRKPAISIDLTV